MQILVMIEPSFRHSNWCRQAVNGIYAEVRRKKYALRFLDETPVDMQSVFGDAPRLVIVIGTSLSWIPNVLHAFEDRNIHAILLNYDFFSLPAHHSVVPVSYTHLDVYKRQVLYRLMISSSRGSYGRRLGRKRSCCHLVKS